MARKSLKTRNSRIEILEPLVLMSASAAEVDFLAAGDELPGQGSSDDDSAMSVSAFQSGSEDDERPTNDPVAEGNALPARPPVEGGESNPTLLLDHAMSITALPTADTAGLAAQSGAVQDDQGPSAGMAAASDLAVGVAIEQPPTYTPTIVGTDAGEWIAGTSGDDAIAAGGGDDEIYAPAGATMVDGGDGEDTLVVYEGSSDQYTIIHRSDGVSFLEGRGLNGETVEVALYNVERIQFNDKTVPVWQPYTPGDNPVAGEATITGTDDGEWLGGTSANDKINAGGGHDEIYAALGENEIDGGDGEDTLLVYQGNRADYTLSNIGDGTIYLEGPGLNGEIVRNTLRNVERILFNDEVVMTADINDLADQVQSMNGPGLSVQAAVAGVSDAATTSEDAAVAPPSDSSTADSSSTDSVESESSTFEASDSSSVLDLNTISSEAAGEILMSASQAFEVVIESGFEDEPITSESVASAAADAVETLENAGVNVEPVSDVDFARVADEASEIAEDAGIDFSSVTASEVAEAATESLESLRQFGTVTKESVSASVDIAIDSLQEDGLVIDEGATQQVVASGLELLESDELDGLEEFLLGMGIDPGNLLSNGE